MEKSALKRVTGGRGGGQQKSYVDYTAMDWAATIDPNVAYERSYMRGSRGRGSNNSIATVKKDYEQRLGQYLSQLPPDPDYGKIPDKYQQVMSDYLSKQKQKYVNHANEVDEYETGSKDYMKRVAEMNQISNSFRTLQDQFSMYGDNKAGIIESIENGTTSLNGENQKNVNFLRGVYNEEFDLEINDDGNIAFLGEDGAINLNDMPGYDPKDFTQGKNMMDMGVQVYKSGKKLHPGGIMYNQYKNQLRMQLDEGGEARVMSVLYDGLVGDTPMIDDPLIKTAHDKYQNGDIALEDLRNTIVDNYMNVLVRQSEFGVNVNGVQPTKGDQKYVADMKLTDSAYQNALQNGDLSDFGHTMPTGWYVEWNEDEGGADKGIVSIYKGDYEEMTLDLNNPKSYYKFLNINKIPKHLWPPIPQQGTGAEQQANEGGGGSYDDL